VQFFAEKQFWCVLKKIHGKRTFLVRPRLFFLFMTMPIDPSASFEHIINIARQRGSEQHSAYAGAVTPTEAWELIRAHRHVHLIDIRTNAERDWIGRVDIDTAQHFAVQWSLYPGAVPNPDFVAQLSAVSRPDDMQLFLCRSGIRSRHAATLATQAGYQNCFDILEGFEGDRDTAGHRKTIGGWCQAGLPWIGA
jgi:rhodanese-related sulfurtransferase